MGHLFLRKIHNNPLNLPFFVRIPSTKAIHFNTIVPTIALILQAIIISHNKESECIGLGLVPSANLLLYRHLSNNYCDPGAYCYSSRDPLAGL